jgi:hypothetical protein
MTELGAELKAKKFDKIDPRCDDDHLASSSLLRLYMSKTEDGIPKVIRTNALTVGSMKVSKVLKIVMKKT